MVAAQGVLESHSARLGFSGSRGKGGISRTGSAGWAVGVGKVPVLELHHLLLPRTQAPSLGADREYAIVLHAHVVQLSAVKLCLLCPQLQFDLLVTWKEKGPGRGYKAGGVKPPCQNREAGALSPRGDGGSLLHASLLHPIWQAVPCMAGQTWLLWNVVAQSLNRN